MAVIRDGAPLELDVVLRSREGKTTLSQQVARRLGIGWISTDVVYELLRLTNVEGIKREWNGAPSAVVQNAEWFFPYLRGSSLGDELNGRSLCDRGGRFFARARSEIGNGFPDSRSVCW